MDSCNYLIATKVREDDSVGKKNDSFNKKTKQKEVQDYKVLLEWLLIIFEGSMDEKVLESMIDRLDYK